MVTQASPNEHSSQNKQSDDDEIEYQDDIFSDLPPVIKVKKKVEVMYSGSELTDDEENPNEFGSSQVIGQRRRIKASSKKKKSDSDDDEPVKKYTTKKFEPIRIDEIKARQYTKVVIEGHEMIFPYKNCYDAMQVYMSRIIRTLRRGHNALLESPTGTGKTAAILIAALNWIKANRKKDTPY